MNCHDFQEQLDRTVVLHGPTANDVAAFQRHLESCQSDGCRQRWEEAELLSEAIRLWRSPGPVVDLEDRVLASLTQPADSLRDRPVPPRLTPTYALVKEPSSGNAGRHAMVDRQRNPLVALGTLVATLLLGLSLLTLSGPPAPEVATQPTASVGQPPVATRSVETADALPSQAPAGQSLRETYAAMPLSASQLLTDAVVLVVPADLAEGDEEPGPADGWADRLGKQWEPIGRGLSSALETLMKAVPDSTTAS